MNQISLTDVAATAGDTTATMTSLEISELTGKRHDHVMEDVRKMLLELGLHAPDFSGAYKTSQGNTYECFNLPKRESLILVSGYSVTMRAKIIDRWEALETGKAQPAMVKNEAPQQIDKPDPQAFAVVQSAWVDAVERKIASKREALQFLRDASAVMIHGVDVLQRAAKPKPAAKALPAPTQSTITIGDKVPYALRAQGTKSATELLREHGKSMQARVLYEIMEKQGMVGTRYEAKDPAGYRVLIGEGLQYGQNVMAFEGTRTTPYFYAGKFGALLGRVGPLVEVEPEPVPKITREEQSLQNYKKIMLGAWKARGKETGEGCPYVSQLALVEYLQYSVGTAHKTAVNMALPSGRMIQPLVQSGFCRPHANGWLITE